MIIDIVPEEFPSATQIRSLCVTAAANLDLDPSVDRVDLVFDAPEFAGHGFWMLEREDSGDILAALYGSPRDVLTVSELQDDPRELDDLDAVVQMPPERIDPLLVDRWLHRNLLQLDDIVRGRVEPHKVPREHSAGLQAVWDVWTDGRLRRRQQPGMSQAERRRIFFRTFAKHGLLLPRHWDTFHRLWEGEAADQDGLLRALEQLPLP